MNSEHHATVFPELPIACTFSGRQPVYLSSPAVARSMHAPQQGEISCCAPALVPSRHSRIPLLRSQAGLSGKYSSLSSKISLSATNPLPQLHRLFRLTLTVSIIYYLRCVQMGHGPNFSSAIPLVSVIHSGYLTFHCSLLSPLFSLS